VRAYKESITATHLAEAALAQAAREIVADSAWALVAEDGDLTFYTQQRLALPRLPRKDVPFGPGHFSYRLSDEEARINLNTSPRDRVDNLLRTLGLDKSDRDVIVDSLLDWKDPGEEHHLNGAESDDYYLKLPVPYRSRNGNLESVRELLQIRGVTHALFSGTEDTPGLVDLVTVKTRGQVNINTASPAVLRTVGLSDAEISEILQTRRDGPYPQHRFGRGLVMQTTTFRIEAEGILDGQVMARLTAVVQKRSEGPGGSLAILEWSDTR
jgi:type II secretory pathway component PulK